MPKPKLTIAVTGLNNTDNPGPGIPFIRGLKEASSFDARIVGLAYENLEPGIYMKDIVDVTYQVPYPSAGTNPMFQRIEQIHAIENIDVIIPNFDAELYIFMKKAAEFKKLGIHTFLPDETVFEERHKANLSLFGEKYGVKVPYSRAIYSTTEIPALVADFAYPLLVKGKYYDAYVAHNPQQVEMYFNKIAGQWGAPIIIQQFVKGTEVNVVALGDGKGQTMGAVPMRKLYITDKGKAWAGITLDDHQMLALTHDLIAKTKWRGGMELELMKTPEGQLYLIEINPRIPAWVYLAVGAGQNMPEALVNLALGNKIKPYTDYEVGKLFIRYSFDLICDIKEFEKLSTYGSL